jgi:hypothetical protein
MSYISLNQIHPSPLALSLSLSLSLSLARSDGWQRRWNSLGRVAAEAERAQVAGNGGRGGSSSGGRRQRRSELRWSRAASSGDRRWRWRRSASSVRPPSLPAAILAPLRFSPLALSSTVAVLGPSLSPPPVSDGVEGEDGACNGGTMFLIALPPSLLLARSTGVLCEFAALTPNLHLTIPIPIPNLPCAIPVPKLPFVVPAPNHRGAT